jgi:hypothetical protein
MRVSQVTKLVPWRCMKWLERAMGLEPTTASLGSGTKLTGALRNALRINAIRPACFSTRQDLSAHSSRNGNQR